MWVKMTGTAAGSTWLASALRLCSPAPLRGAPGKFDLHRQDAVNTAISLTGTEGEDIGWKGLGEDHARVPCARIAHLICASKNRERPSVGLRVLEVLRAEIGCAHGAPSRRQLFGA